MPIVIRTNPTSLGTLKALDKTQRMLTDSMVKLSSGMRINSARDDAAGLAISENLRSDIVSLGQATRNASDAISVLQIAEAAMGEIGNNLLRVRELAMQAASGQLSQNQRDFIHDEMEEHKQEISRIAQVTEFAGKKLLDGSVASGAATLIFQVGINNAATDRLPVNIATMGQTGIGMSTMSLSLQTRAQSALDIIDSAINTVSSRRANLGARMNRLEIVIDNLASAEENIMAANSRIRDTDVGREMGNLVAQQILSQAGSAMLSQANSLPQMALSLLGAQ